MVKLFIESGTTGQPRGVVHDHSYPLAHIVTAHYWHQAGEGDLQEPRGVLLLRYLLPSTAFARKKSFLWTKRRYSVAVSLQMPKCHAIAQMSGEMRSV